MLRIFGHVLSQLLQPRIDALMPTLPQMGELLPNETSHGVRYQLGHSAILAAAFVTYACSHTLPAK